MKVNLENVPKEFEDLYNKLLNEFPNKLRVLKKKYTICFILNIISFLAAFVCFATANFLAFLISTIIFIISVVFSTKFSKKYNLLYKNSIIKKFIQLVSNKLSYEPEVKNISEVKSLYSISGFDTEYYDKFSADDYIHGYIQENIFIRLYDLALTKTEKDNDGHYQTVSVFTGLFLINDSLKNINSSIRIKRNQIKIFSSNKEKVEIDNSTFEKYFDVYSSNEILTMRILTPDVLNTIVDFAEKNKILFEITFKDDKIFFRFFTGATFVPKILGNPTDKKSLYTYYYIINFIKDISILTNNAIADLEL